MHNPIHLSQHTSKPPPLLFLWEIPMVRDPAPHSCGSSGRTGLLPHGPHAGPDLILVLGERLKDVLDQRVADAVDLWELALDAGGVEKVVGPRRYDDLCLLLDREVLPGKLRVDVLLVQLQDLVVADGAGVGVVHDSGQLPAGHLDGHWEQLREDGHGVGDVDDLLVLDDLGDEVAGVEDVLDDRHPHTQSEHVVERLEEVLCHGLAVRVV
mmetsp:Transcript_15714/g.37324  ORF Transcript_15714/g.37324 Transcript_15714/m.37324 type:complete len:211 (+) Transcript_15714:108-740(+)